MTKKKVQCIRCGMCCKAIVISDTKKQLKKYKYNDDAKFILKNWRRISKKEAIKRNSYLKKWEEDGLLRCICQLPSTKVSGLERAKDTVGSSRRLRKLRVD